MDSRTDCSGLTEKMWLSLLGVVPLGVYVFAHLWTNLSSLGGPETFDAALVSSRSHPAFFLIETVGLGIPILVHAWIGLRIILRMRPNNSRYRSLSNLRYLLQRVSALGVLAFLGAHVIKARIMPAMATRGGHESWQGMHEALSEPITFAVYALGLLGVAFHLSNGLWGASMTFGLTISKAAQARMQWVSGLVFVLLLGMSALAMYGFRPFM